MSFTAAGVLKLREPGRVPLVEAAGLTETSPDTPIATATPFARGHSAKPPLGRRVVKMQSEAKTARELTAKYAPTV